jgi:sugar phosphate isomerase/epimerase
MPHATQAGPPMDDVVHRVLPGQGELGVADLLATLDDRGVRCPVGVEVLRREILEGGAEMATKRLYQALVEVVGDARARTAS